MKKIKQFSIILLAAILICITTKIELYADDFYYQSFFNEGFQNFIQQNINHYQEVNGRVIAHVLAEVFLNINKIFYIIFLLLCLGYIFYFGISFLLPEKMKKDKQNILTAICISLSMFFCVSIFVLKETAFWITGAMNYILPTTIACLAISSIKKADIQNKLKISHIILLFLAGAITEQGFLLTMFCTLGYFIIQNINKKIILSKNQIMILIAEILGFLTIFLSPASRNRADIAQTIFNTPLLEFIQNNFGVFATRIVGENSIFLIVSILIISISLLSLKDEKLGKILRMGFLIGGSIIILNVFKIYNENIAILMTTLIIFYVLIAIFKLSLEQNYKNIAILIGGAFFLQAATFALGESSYRIFWMLSILCAIISANIITIIMDKMTFSEALHLNLIPSKLFTIKNDSIILTLFIAVGFLNSLTILNGYNYNQSIFNAMKESIKNYNKNGFVEININIDEKYAHDMGYENGAFFDYFLENYNIKEIEEDVYFVNGENTEIYINKTKLRYPAYFEKNEIYIPLRFVVEALNGKCEWTKETTKYECEENVVVVDNISNIIIESNKAENNNISLRDSFRTFLGRTYINIKNLKYFVGENESRVAIGRY